MWTWNDVHADQFANPACCCRSGVSCSFHRANVSAHKHGHVPSADVFLSQQLNVGCFDHRVSRFHRANKTFGLDHSECFKRHLRQSSLFKIVEIKTNSDSFSTLSPCALRIKRDETRKSIKFDKVTSERYSAVKE